MKRLSWLVLALAVVAGPVYGDSVGARAAFADARANESFDAYELFLVFDLPWSWTDGQNVFRTQLELTGGVLDAAGESGALATLGPRLAIESGRFTLDLGVGVAALGETEFGDHDFGGSSQFTAQAGLSVAVLERFNLGVRYRHMSDADLHDGDDLDLFFVEASYDFHE